MPEARSIMTTNVFTVFPDTPLIHAAKLFADKHISGLPVVDEEKHLVGIISEKDLLGLLVDDSDTGKCVGDFMTKDVFSFDSTESLKTICQFLMENDVRRVPITENGKLAGVVSRRDVLSEIIRAQH